MKIAQDGVQARLAVTISSSEAAGPAGRTGTIVGGSTRRIGSDTRGRGPSGGNVDLDHCRSDAGSVSGGNSALLCRARPAGEFEGESVVHREIGSQRLCGILADGVPGNCLEILCEACGFLGAHVVVAVNF